MAWIYWCIVGGSTRCVDRSTLRPWRTPTASHHTPGGLCCGFPRRVQQRHHRARALGQPAHDLRFLDGKPEQHRHGIVGVGRLVLVAGKCDCTLSEQRRGCTLGQAMATPECEYVLTQQQAPVVLAPCLKPPEILDMLCFAGCRCAAGWTFHHQQFHHHGIAARIEMPFACGCPQHFLLTGRAQPGRGFVHGMIRWNVQRSRDGN